MMIFQREECWLFLTNKSPNPVTSVSLSTEMNASLLHKTTKMREGFDVSQQRLKLKAFYLASDDHFSVKNS